MRRAEQNLRERRRAETRRSIQAHAMRLFAAAGYDATTVNDVAEAAGVSAMTVYRHFATKEDIVLYDEFDDLTAAAVAARPADEPLRQRIGRALVETVAATVGSAGTSGGPGASGPSGASARTAAERELVLARLRLMITTPALRARHLDNQYALQNAIVAALCGDDPDPEEALRVHSTTSACLGAMHVALVRWAENDGRDDLAALIRTALTSAFDAEF